MTARTPGGKRPGPGPAAAAAQVKARALDLGFDACGITDLEPTPHGEELGRWLESGMAGTMRYMHRQADRRRRPSTILPGATRAVVVTKGYYSGPDPALGPGHGRVAKYARGRDYHDTLASQLNRLAGFLKGLCGPDCAVRYYVDAGPVPERELAQRAGLGWIGKNTMLIDPARGSYCFIGAILTSTDLAIDRPFEADRCGSCTKCLDACPTDAFPAERVLDSRLCISYLTIEHRGPLEPGVSPDLGEWVFGCDVCQDVCPWNVKFACAVDSEWMGLDPSLSSLQLDELAAIGDEEFVARYGHTPLRRPGASGMRRNARAVSGRGGEG